MKSYIKEIAVSAAAVLLLVLAVVFFLQILRNSRQGSETNIYTLVPSNVESALIINRPDLFGHWLKDNETLYTIFAGSIPEVFLTVLKRSEDVNLALITLHSQGALCCIRSQSPAKIAALLDNIHTTYPPQKREANGITFYYYHEPGNRFFGYYTYNNVWVGSYSRKLLERAASQQLRNELMAPDDIILRMEEVDRNSPAGIVIHSSMIGLDALPEENESGFLAADLFVNNGKICAYMRLPSFTEEAEEVVSSFLADRYPLLQFTFQTSTEREGVSATCCAPLPE